MRVTIPSQVLDTCFQLAEFTKKASCMLSDDSRRIGARQGLPLAPITSAAVLLPLAIKGLRKRRGGEAGQPRVAADESPDGSTDSKDGSAPAEKQGAPGAAAAAAAALISADCAEQLLLLEGGLGSRRLAGELGAAVVTSSLAQGDAADG